MLGEDSLVLSRLVYTLGVIMYAAINTMVIECVCHSLLMLVIYGRPQCWGSFCL